MKGIQVIAVYFSSPAIHVAPHPSHGWVPSPSGPSLRFELLWPSDLVHIDHEPSYSRGGGDKGLTLLTPSLRSEEAGERSSRTVITGGRIRSQAPVLFICNLSDGGFVVFLFLFINSISSLMDTTTIFVFFFSSEIVRSDLRFN